jgi:hypothetical protein
VHAAVGDGADAVFRLHRRLRRLRRLGAALQVVDAATGGDVDERPRCCSCGVSALLLCVSSVCVECVCAAFGVADAVHTRA